MSPSRRPRTRLFDGSEPAAKALAAVRTDPQFPAAMRLMSRGAIALYRGNSILNTVGNDRWRFLISVFAIHLHFACQPDDPRSGLTLGRLRRLCVEQKVCSRGRAEAMLEMMRTCGYLAPAPAAGDRRLRRLVPTAELIAWHRERATFIFKAMALVLPEGAQALSALGSAAFMQHFMCRLSESYLAGFFYVDRIPDMKLFLERNAGMMILYSLLLAGEPQDSFPPLRPVSISTSGLARGFGVSRVHVRRLLLDAVKRGFLERTGPSGEGFRVLPRLTDAFASVLAMYIVHNAQCVRLALADMARADEVA